MTSELQSELESIIIALNAKCDSENPAEKLQDCQKVLIRALEESKEKDEHFTKIVRARAELQETLISRETKYKTMLQATEREWLQEKEILLSDIQLTQERLAGTELKLQMMLPDIDRLKHRCVELESQLKCSEESIDNLHLKLDEANQQLYMKNQDLQSMEKKLHLSSSSLSVLLEEKNVALAEKNNTLHDLESELVEKREVNNSSILRIESLESKVNNYQEKVQVLEESIAALKASLCLKTEEVANATASREASEAKLIDTLEELRLAKMELQQQKQNLTESICASNVKIQEILKGRQDKDKEIVHLLTCLESRENALNDLEVKKETLLQENQMFKESVHALQGKIEMLKLKIENDDSTLKRLCSHLEEKEMNLALRSQEVKDLQQIIENSGTSKRDSSQYEQKSKELEENLAELTASLHDKEEKLCASEWAVQQLANEVAKAKNGLAMKEKEEMLLHNKLFDVKTRLKAKEQEVLEMDRQLQNLVKRNTSKQLEVERLSQAVEKLESRENEWKEKQNELMSQIEHLGKMLEDKTGDMSVCRAQLQQKQEREKMMEDAIESLKSKLAEQARGPSEWRSQLSMLCEQLETTQSEECLLAGQLQDAESKLHQLEQSFHDQISKLQDKLLEQPKELALSSSRLCGLKMELQAANEEVEIQKGNCCELTGMVAVKESCLKDLQAKFDLLQKDFGEQTKLVMEKDMELILAREDLREFYERQCLYEHMRVEKDMLEKKVDIMANQLTIGNEETQQLKLKLEQLQMVSPEGAALNDQLMKVTTELNHSRKSIQDRDSKIFELKEVLHNSERKIQQLTAEVQAFQNREEECAKWTDELLIAERGLEKEMRSSLLSHLRNTAESCVSKWKEDSTHFCLQIKAASSEMIQLKTCWKLVVEAYEENILLMTGLILALKEGLQSIESKLQNEEQLALYHAGVTRELQVEMSELKQALTTSVCEASHRMSELANANMTIDRLKNELQEQAEKERKAQEELLSLRLVLEDSERALKKESEELQCRNALLVDVQVELEKWKGTAEEACEDRNSVRSDMDKACQCGEEMNAIVEKEKEKRALQAELAEWRQKADDLGSQIERCEEEKQQLQDAIRVNAELTETVAELRQQMEMEMASWEEEKRCVERKWKQEEEEGRVQFDEADKRRQQAEAQLQQHKSMLAQLQRSQVSRTGIQHSLQALYHSMLHDHPPPPPPPQQAPAPAIDPDEFHHYLELCDSLIRKNARLEKQLEKWNRRCSSSSSSKKRGMGGVPGCSPPKRRRSGENADVAA